MFSCDVIEKPRAPCFVQDETYGDSPESSDAKANRKPCGRHGKAKSTKYGTGGNRYNARFQTIVAIVRWFATASFYLTITDGFIMRIAFFVTCLVDLMRPSIGFAAIELLESCGHEVVVPETQTCCGQPAWNAGERDAAAALAKKVIAEFEAFDYVVAPSGACADHIKNTYPQILAAEPAWQNHAAALAAKTFELTDFLVNVATLNNVPGSFSGSVTYHDSCSGLRGLGVKEQPRALLSRVPGLTLKEMTDSEACCGFGGMFSVRFGDISTAIVDRKCNNIEASGADAVVGGDLGCLLNIEGRLRRRGNEQMRVLHIAEVLAGNFGDDGDGSGNNKGGAR